MTPEGKELSRITRWLKANRINYVRLAFQPGVAAGWPDLMVLLSPGVPLFLEIKRPGKGPTPLQATRLGQLNELGFNAGWFDNADKAIAAIAATIDSIAANARHHANAAVATKVSALGTSALHEPRGGVPDHPPVGGAAAGTGGP